MINFFGLKENKDFLLHLFFSSNYSCLSVNHNQTRNVIHILLHTKKVYRGLPLVLYSYLNGPHFLSVEKRIQISLVWPFQPMGGITNTLILILSFLSYRIDCKICYRSVPVFFSLFFSSLSLSLSGGERGLIYGRPNLLFVYLF